MSASTSRTSAGQANGFAEIEILADRPDDVAVALGTPFGLTRESGADGAVALRAGDARIVVRRPASAEESEWVARHGDGVRTVAFAAEGDDDTDAGPLLEESDLRYRMALRHEAASSAPSGQQLGITRIDHIALGMRAEDLSAAEVAFKELGMGRDPEEAPGGLVIDSAGSAFRLFTFLTDDASTVIAFAVPEAGDRTSNITTFMERHGGSGVHHIAFAVDDLVGAVDALRRNGGDTLPVPSEYYASPIPGFADNTVLQDRNILFEGDEEHHLKQVFVASFLPQRTTLVELIERRGRVSFGAGNVTGLGEAELSAG